MTKWALPRDGIDSVVTIGKFDGVHIGHREVVSQLRARANGRRVVVVTFDRHPLELFDPARAPQPILSIPQKVEALFGRWRRPRRRPAVHDGVRGDVTRHVHR